MLTFVGAVIVIVALGAEPLPSASPAAGSLPEIGRVRSAAPACAAMRDLVIPSFAAARRADARFEETRKRLPTFGELMTDKSHDDDVFRESALAKLDNDATKLLGEALIINRALGDPRLAASKDPAVIEERNQLQQLYDTQKTRANLLWEYVMRHNIALSKAKFAADPTIGGRHQPLPQDAGDAPNRDLVVLPGMPLESRIGLASKRRLEDWGTEIAASILVSENAAAKAFLPIAIRCR